MSMSSFVNGSVGHSARSIPRLCAPLIGGIHIFDNSQDELYISMDYRPNSKIDQIYQCTFTCYVHLHLVLSHTRVRFKKYRFLVNTSRCQLITPTRRAIARRKLMSTWSKYNAHFDLFNQHIYQQSRFPP